MTLFSLFQLPDQGNTTITANATMNLLLGSIGGRHDSTIVQYFLDTVTDLLHLRLRDIMLLPHMLFTISGLSVFLDR